MKFNIKTAFIPLSIVMICKLLLFGSVQLHVSTTGHLQFVARLTVVWGD